MASAALALTVILGGTGCAMLTYQATTEKYDASDGVSADVGALAVRNILLVMEEGGSDANLVFTVSNSSDEDAELEIGLADGDSQTVEVEAHGQVVLGADDDQEEPLLIEGIDAKPGDLVDLYLSTGGSEGLEIPAPVLDGRLPEYRALRP
ncbi:DNA modification methylase [Agromyces sp. MMS24-K17]|uniref:DNA modification methylase n=1 Tax=Agromyces sp. MMS24-K17 TaxID=3372850 RepID=UPI003753EB06